MFQKQIGYSLLEVVMLFCLCCVRIVIFLDSLISCFVFLKFLFRELVVFWIIFFQVVCGIKFFGLYYRLLQVQCLFAVLFFVFRINESVYSKVEFERSFRNKSGLLIQEERVINLRVREFVQCVKSIEWVRWFCLVQVGFESCVRLYMLVVLCGGSIIILRVYVFIQLLFFLEMYGERFYSF